MDEIAIVNGGDNTHDVHTFNLQVGAGPTGPWTTVHQGSLTSRVLGFQNITGFCGTSRYWRFYVTSCHDRWQPYINEIAWHGTVTPSCQITTSPTAAPTAEPTSPPTHLPTTLPTDPPTLAPTALPTAGPTALPSATPTTLPSGAPTTAVANSSNSNGSSSNNSTFPISILVAVAAVCAVILVVVGIWAVRRFRKPDKSRGVGQPRSPKAQSVANPLYEGSPASAYHPAESGRTTSAPTVYVAPGASTPPTFYEVPVVNNAYGTKATVRVSPPKSVMLDSAAYVAAPSMSEAMYSTSIPQESADGGGYLNVDGFNA